jgi:hypothetical protein
LHGGVPIGFHVFVGARIEHERPEEAHEEEGHIPYQSRLRAAGATVESVRDTLELRVAPTVPESTRGNFSAAARFSLREWARLLRQPRGKAIAQS